MRDSDRGESELIGRSLPETTVRVRKEEVARDKNASGRLS